ncbi:MAG: GNAT family N-acetyltransferase [Victivallaceae bacterium]
MKITITVADKSDLAEILALQKKVFTKVAMQLHRFDLPPLFQTEAEIAAEFTTGTILKCHGEDGRIIGSVRAEVDENNFCRIGKLVVDPEFQRRGIGRALMEAIEKRFARTAGYVLFTSADTPESCNLYRRLGYDVIAKKESGGLLMLFMSKPTNTSAIQS